MDVILHIGAHRTATTTFQQYLKEQAPILTPQGFTYWGPHRTRSGLFRGLYASGAENAASYRRAVGRVRMNVQRCRDRGRRTLFVSDENMSGAVRDNLRREALYPGIGTRLAQVNEGFDGKIDQVILTIRSLDLYWISALGYAVSRGHRKPNVALLDRLVTAPRSWRNVITDVACAVPSARVRVLPFETLNGRPDAVLSAILGAPAAPDSKDRWLNATPKLAELREISGSDRLPDGDGRWNPFDAAQSNALREKYQDDLHWLSAGADGLAEPMAYEPHNKSHLKAGSTPPQTDTTEGCSHDSQQGHMAPPRRE
ncbi:MAG: hypothetical protein AAGF79_13195 [Pseudomonadota bacterium]